MVLAHHQSFPIQKQPQIYTHHFQHKYRILFHLCTFNLVHYKNSFGCAVRNHNTFYIHYVFASARLLNYYKIIRYIFLFNIVHTIPPKRRFKLVCVLVLCQPYRFAVSVKFNDRTNGELAEL